MKSGKNDIIEKMIQAKAILAPMSGVTDIPFRMISRKYGCRFAFTEMIDVNGIVYNNLKSFKLLERIPEDDPLGIQLVGQDVEKFLYVAKICEEKGFKLFDINAGCPARKVIKGDKGSALMKDSVKLAGIVRELVKVLTIPVTVKIRSGWDEDTVNCVEIAKAVQGEGAKAICVHPRTREQMYKGRPDHELTREIKETVSIPVFASGNIFKAQDALDILAFTKCDAVFIARGALGRPWIFNEIYEYLSGNTSIKGPTFSEIKNIIIEHFRLCIRFDGESRALSRMYKHLAWYLKKLKNLDAIMKAYRKLESASLFEGFIDRLCLENERKLFLK